MSVVTVTKETKPKMTSVIDDFKRKLANVRTGRATVGILDGVTVDYYGVPTPLSQMASISVPEPQMLVVQPWDATQLGEIEKAINMANIGINPSNDGKLIRLPIPSLNEERRREMAKQVGDIAEEHRIAIRNIRHGANDTLKQMQKDKEISEDEEHRGFDEVQKLTDQFIEEIDSLGKTKEEEIMSV